MGYFKNTTVWGTPCNFGVSYGRRTKLGNMEYFDVLASKMVLVFKFRPIIGNMEGLVTLLFSR